MSRRAGRCRRRAARRVIRSSCRPVPRRAAARFAEVIFTFQHAKSDMLAFRADMHERMRAAGRDPADCVILPCIDTIIGETEAMAE